jgi:hypothetical protein
MAGGGTVPCAPGGGGGAGLECCVRPLILDPDEPDVVVLNVPGRRPPEGPSRESSPLRLS